MKNIYLFKRLTLAFIFLVTYGLTFGQALLIEDADYPEGDSLINNNWLLQSTNVTNPILVANKGLYYNGYAGSGYGNAISMGVTGQDLFRGFTEQASGVVYLACLFNVTSTTESGEYFIALRETATSPTNTNYRGRLHVKRDAANKLAIGISKGGGPTYTDYIYSLNTTYLGVIKYTINPGTDDDLVDLFIDPVPGNAEPAANVSASDTKTEVGLGSVLLRQGSSGNSTTAIVDGIRVATTWEDAVAEGGAKGPAPLIFSEYFEGSSNNKGLEIYNPGEDTINLDNYQIAQSVGGGGWEHYHMFPAGDSLLPGDVWVIVTDQIDPEKYDTLMANEVLGYPSVVHHTGDDARGIFYINGADTMLLDVFGIPDEDPGNAWSVAGIDEATANHTLVRKRYILQGNTKWTKSAGTDSYNSEWIVYDSDFLDSLGIHTYAPFIEVTAVNVTAEGGVTEITADKDTLQLIAEVLPANANDDRLEWSVNDPVLATVNQDGRLIAINDGTVTVTATALDGSDIKGTIDVTLSNQVPVIPVSTITLTGAAGASTIDTSGGTLQLSAEVLPVDASDASITWSVNNEGMASIDQTGLVTAISNGTAVVKAIANDGFGGEGTFEVVISNQLTEVADLAELRAKDPADKTTVYKVKGEVVITFQQSFRNKKFVQDAGGGVMIDDSPGAFTTTYAPGDGITGIMGTLEEYNGMLQFHPVTDPGVATSTGNSVTGLVITLAELKANFESYESKVITVENVTFNDADGALQFANGTDYNMTDGAETVICRVDFYNTTLTGSIIPDSANVTGVLIEYKGIPELSPRYLEDVENLAPYVPSSDASISDLMVSGITVAGFTPAQITYNVKLGSGTTEVPAVTVVTNDANAVVTVTDATNLAGTEAERTSTVLITAEDGITTKTYVVIFSMSVGIEDISEGLIEIYPVPANTSLHLENVGSIEEVRVVDITGSTLKIWELYGENSVELDVSELNSGVFFLNLSNSESSRIIRFIKE